MTGAAGTNLQIMTANRLADGVVVYLTPDGAWAETLEGAQTVNDETGAQGLVRAAEIAVELRQVVGPYLIDLAERQRRPVRLRERIRLGGPTVDFGGSNRREED